MPLVRHRYFGEDYASFFEFSMRNGNAAVQFTVSPSVLNAIDGVAETIWDQRDAQFLRLRDNPPADQKAVALSAADFQRWGIQME